MMTVSNKNTFRITDPQWRGVAGQYYESFAVCPAVDVKHWGRT